MNNLSAASECTLVRILRLSLGLAAWGALHLPRALPAGDFQYPLAVAATTETVYVADRNLPGVWTVAEGHSKLFFQGSKQFRTPLNAIRCVAIDRQGRLIAGDSSTRQVYRFDSGIPIPLLKTKTGIGIPMGVAVDRQNNLFVADLETHRLWKLPADGNEPTMFAEVAAPRGLTIDDEDRLWVVSHGSDQILRISTDGRIETVVRGRPFQFPHQVALDDRKIAYVSDGYAKAVWKVEGAGAPTKWITGDPLKNPVGLCWSQDRLLIADPHAQALFAADREGRLVRLSPPSSNP